MGKKDPRVDVYINKAREFAKPVLEHIRDFVHETCPDVEEKIKWSFPHFDYKNQMMCSMASFKEHCTFGFWKASLLKDLKGKSGQTAMGQFGRMTKVSDLPSKKVLKSLIKDAMKLNDSEIKISAKSKSSKKKELIVPGYFMKAIKKNKKALKTFENFSYSQKKEYVEWVTEAKTEPTRKKRIATAIEWMSEGKIHNWKYLKK
ncbi:YdeI/OmpD-associated family protein [bacterium BMS3Abin03]|nr:YdeI/OmpD-associated family protein [bacterium BMS3Abin03]